MLNAIIKEISLQKDYLDGEMIETIYFGGGTPSLLSGLELGQIIDEIREHHTISANPEITLEANPDDLDLSKLTALKLIGINRLSIGVQSFYDEDLKWMNRAHNAHEARSCIEDAKRAGFDNISMDLIFGSPTTSNEMWQNNLEIASDFSIPHFSCYALTVEPKTALHDMIKKGKTPAPPDVRIQEQFYMTHDYLEDKGYEHYEISNYAKGEKYSQHNTSYWKGKKYLGIGPAAHSYNRASRMWNIAHNIKYIESIKEEKVSTEKEHLSPADIFNEYLMTGMRTKWGCDKKKMQEILPQEHAKLWDLLESAAASGKIIDTGTAYILSRNALVIADSVISDFFIVNE